MQETFDHIVIGSGLNSLVCATLLARKGKKVCLLERNESLGGCIVSDSASVPGFTFDLMSTSHVQFLTSPAYAELADDLHGAGLEYLTNAEPLGAMLPDGRSIILSTDMEESMGRIAAISEADAAAMGRLLGRFGSSTDVVFGLLGSEPWSLATVKMLLRAAWQRGIMGLAKLFGELLATTRETITANIESDEIDALLAPGCLHCGMSPDATMSNIMGSLVTFSIMQAADPLVKGGSANLVMAFEILLQKYGATVRTGADVSAILTASGRVTGVALAGGEEIKGRGVIANVTPTQLYQRLLPAADVPETIAREAAEYRYGRSCLMVHIAMDEKPQWVDGKMGEVAMMHLTGGLNAVTKAVSEAERDLLPAEPTICVVQPCAVDPSRAPEGKWILWLQMLEMPQRITGDARGEISIPPGGAGWSEDIKEGLTARLVEQLAKVIPNLRDNIIWKKVISPEDLQQMNINLVGGDPYSGHCGINQQLIYRPLPSLKNHKTPVKGLYQIGASTHPGPGLGGMSGYQVAKSLGA